MTDEKKPIPVKVRSAKRIKQLSNVEKAEAVTLWKSGSVTLDDLATRFKRDRSTFVRLFNKVGATKGEDAVKAEQKVTEAVEATLVGDAIVHAQRVKETKDDNYKMARGIAVETWRVMAKAKEEKRSIGTSLNDLKALHCAAQIIKITREERYAVLGLNEDKREDTDDVPDLIVKELTAEEIKQMNTASLGEDAIDADFVSLDDLGKDIEEVA